GLKGPVAVIPNGVTPPGQHISERLFFERYPDLRGRRIVIFLSRVHHKKGLDILCKAWQRVWPLFRDTHLVIAGPDFENTLASIEALMSELGIGDGVTITGMLEGEMKWSALAASRLFVLPSHSEGFSMAILEAMATGLPVLATHPCNFPEI